MSNNQSDWKLEKLQNTLWNLKHLMVKNSQNKIEITINTIRFQFLQISLGKKF